MDLNDLHPPDDYSHRFFIWHEWIQANGPLNNDNVFDYFATSMFYDKQSNNQVLRMQTMHTGLPLVNEAEELKRFTGIEFALVHSQPPSLFIIHKRNRISPDDVMPLAAYFIMNNRIYQSPDVYTLLSNRLLTSLHSLQSSLDILRSHKPAYTPRTGFAWPIVEQSTPEDSNKNLLGGDTGTSQDSTESSTKQKAVSTVVNAKKRQNNILLLNAMRTTAIHANQSFTPLVVTSEETTAETPAPESVHRSSATPAPASQPPRGTTPKVVMNTPTPQEAPTRGLPGAGKKKKKRTSLIPPQG